MKRKRLGGAIIVGLWAIAGVIVIACGDDDATSPRATTPEAGATSQPTSTSTGMPDVGTPNDTGAPDAGADARAIWAFNAYCGDAIDASCPDAAACPSFDGGGVAAQDCPTPFDRCVSPQKAEAGIADRVFVCESTATPTWATNRICDFEPCDNVDASACPSFAGTGIAGQTCPTPRDRCLGNQRVYICEGNGLVQDFNGYCDAGMGTRACSDEVDACAPADGGIPGSTCATEHARCYGKGSDGNKIFVCARR